MKIAEIAGWSGREFDVKVLDVVLDKLVEGRNGAYYCKTSLAVAVFPDGVPERHQFDEDGIACWEHGEGNRWITRLVPYYSTDIAADYSVLQHMCKEIFHVREQFFSMLNKIVHTRAPNCKIVSWPHALIFYRVGDYARAALATKLIENGELEEART